MLPAHATEIHPPELGNNPTMNENMDTIQQREDDESAAAQDSLEPQAAEATPAPAEDGKNNEE